MNDSVDSPRPTNGSSVPLQQRPLPRSPQSPCMGFRVIRPTHFYSRSSCGMYRRHSIEELRQRPCRKGHSRHDAYIAWQHRSGCPPLPWLRCRTCHIESPSYARFKARLKETKSRYRLDDNEVTPNQAPTIECDSGGHELPRNAFATPRISNNPKERGSVRQPQINSSAVVQNLRSERPSIHSLPPRR